MTDRKDPAHRAYIQSLPCLACGSTWCVECAHVSMRYCGEVTMPYNDQKATNCKVADRWTVPLCRQCHMIQHSSNSNNQSERHFWEQRNINPLAAAQSLHRVTGNTLAGRNILLRYRNGATDL